MACGYVCKTTRAPPRLTATIWALSAKAPGTSKPTPLATPNPPTETPKQYSPKAKRRHSHEWRRFLFLYQRISVLLCVAPMLTLCGHWCLQARFWHERRGNRENSQPNNKPQVVGRNAFD